TATVHGGRTNGPYLQETTADTPRWERRAESPSVVLPRSPIDTLLSNRAQIKFALAHGPGAAPAGKLPEDLPPQTRCFRFGVTGKVNGQSLTLGRDVGSAGIRSGPCRVCKSVLPRSMSLAEARLRGRARLATFLPTRRCSTPARVRKPELRARQSHGR